MSLSFYLNPMNLGLTVSWAWNSEIVQFCSRFKAMIKLIPIFSLELCQQLRRTAQIFLQFKQKVEWATTESPFMDSEIDMTSFLVLYLTLTIFK